MTSKQKETDWNQFMVSIFQTMIVDLIKMSIQTFSSGILPSATPYEQPPENRHQATQCDSAYSFLRIHSAVHALTLFSFLKMD